MSSRPLPGPGTFSLPHRALLHSAVALGMAGLLMACGEDEPVAPPPPEVVVVKVIQRDQPIAVEFVGQTRGSADIPIRARAEGVLLGMHFNEGQRLEEGDPPVTPSIQHPTTPKSSKHRGTWQNRAPNSPKPRPTWIGSSHWPI